MVQGSIIHRRQRQYGAASVAIAFLVLFLIAGALATAFGLSGSVVRDATMSAQQAQALFLAESGLARALKRYGNGTLCGSLGPDGPYSLGQGNFTVVSGGATDFSGAALPAAQCRVQVKGIVSGVSRTIEGIMQRSTNGFPPQANVNFNQPVGTCVYPGCMPTNWNFSQAGWLDTGGPDSSRAAYIAKSASGSGIDVSAGGYSFYPPITRVGPKTLKIDVDYKNSVVGGSKKIHVNFWLYQQAPGTGVWSTVANGTAIDSGNTSGWLRTGTPGGEASATINLPAGTFRIDRIDFKLTADSGNNYSSVIDNISIDGEDTGLTTEEKAVLLSWREVVQ
ncbi:hypothetical protein [Noviherbaspirillum sp. UKPF54]|uniref:hypothetical protein n=1 Tax=Noviherbaspirillum sp. UKPF54 TaxID=2601898 RepID=UPI0011B14C83|nr:hypothetical protein [Noviherbaspirillum sp. UKPF54]QDZ28279.1 hypothetical protein FAY22_10190 [Noviherbaspirillum sp. UKPF54]